MKQFVIAALAIAAMVACSKEDAPVLDSTKKSVTIKIENLSSESRGVTTPSSTSNYVCADASDLTIVFCDAAGNRVGNAVKLNSGEGTGPYTFHGLGANVSQFFVIGNDAGTLTAPATLTEALAMWNADQVDDELSEVVVFGKSGTFEYQGDCTDPADNDVKYPLYAASANVAPNVARIEVSTIGCTDLGAYEYDADPMTFGFDKLELKSLTFGTHTETLTGVLQATNPVTAQSYSPADGQVWSWNVAGGAVSSYPLSLMLDATAASYTNFNPTKTLTATSYSEGASAVTSFDKGHIYKMKVNFSEQDLLTDVTNICVEVAVSIADWTVHNDITPNFN